MYNYRYVYIYIVADFSLLMVAFDDSPCGRPLSSNLTVQWKPPWQLPSVHFLLVGSVEIGVVLGWLKALRSASATVTGRG